MSAWFCKNQQEVFKILGSLVALGSLFFLLKQQSWDDIFDAVQQISWQRFLLVLGLLFFSRFFVIGRWYILLHSSGIKMGFGQATTITFTGLFASNFLPSTVGGDLVRIGGTIQLGYDRAISTASVLVDRLIGMVGMTMLAPVGLLSLFQWYTTHPERYECRWADILNHTRGARVVCPAFGSSDCNCGAHLFHFKRKPGIKTFRRKVGTHSTVKEFRVD